MVAGQIMLLLVVTGGFELPSSQDGGRVQLKGQTYYHYTTRAGLKNPVQELNLYLRTRQTTTSKYAADCTSQKQQHSRDRKTL